MLDDAIALYLGLTLLGAAVAKIRSPSASALAVNGAMPWLRSRFGRSWILALATVEAIIAVAVLSVDSRPVAVVLMTSFVLFAALTLLPYVRPRRGPVQPCGCFGESSPSVGAATVVVHILWAALAVTYAAVVWRSEAQLAPLRVALASLVVAALVVGSRVKTRDNPAPPHASATL